MSKSSHAFQLEFLNKLQRLLQNGSFSSTYKFALLIAIADLCVEQGSDSNEQLTIKTRDIAKKFISLYQRQTIPFPGTKTKVFQNSGNQSKVISDISKTYSYSKKADIFSVRSNVSLNQLVSRTNQTVKKMPLWKLQVVGNDIDDFIYTQTGSGSIITLKENVPYCFRKFHGLITSLVRGHWCTWVRKLEKNKRALGSGKYLEEYLFGVERKPLSKFPKILDRTQNGCCFYCDKKMKGTSEVDHFIPWSKYPHDLGHNFVLSHKKCNLSKSDSIAAQCFKTKWKTRNAEFEDELFQAFDSASIPHDLSISQSVVSWAYQNALEIGATLWSP